MIVERINLKRWKIMRDAGEALELGGHVYQVGAYFMACPAHYGLGEPMIGEPVQALFNSLSDAAAVLA